MPHLDHSFPDPANVIVTVETVADGKWLAHAGDRALAFERPAGAPDDEPRVLDEDLGSFAEIQQPRFIRRTIETLRREDKNFKPFEVRAHSAQTGGRPTTKYLLTELEAIYVLMHLRTEKARACKWMFARMVKAVRGGAPALDVSAILRALGRSEAKIAELEARVAGTPIYLTPKERAAQLRTLLGQYAERMTRLAPQTKPRSHRTRAESQLRAIVGFPRSAAHTLDAMPFEMWERAMLHARSLLAAVASLLPRATQLDLGPSRSN